MTLVAATSGSTASGCMPPISRSTPISSAASAERTSESPVEAHDLEGDLAVVGVDGVGERAQLVEREPDVLEPDPAQPRTADLGVAGQRIAHRDVVTREHEDELAHGRGLRLPPSQRALERVPREPVPLR